MDREALAELLGNLHGIDVNDATKWADLLADADTMLRAVARGEMEPWWENGGVPE